MKTSPCHVLFETIVVNNYPPAGQLATVINQGQPIAGPSVPVNECVGNGEDPVARAEASRYYLSFLLY